PELDVGALAPSKPATQGEVQGLITRPIEDVAARVAKSECAQRHYRKRAEVEPALRRGVWQAAAADAVRTGGFTLADSAVGELGGEGLARIEPAGAGELPSPREEVIAERQLISEIQTRHVTDIEIRPPALAIQTPRVLCRREAAIARIVQPRRGV